MEKLLLDTDIGTDIDDAVALAYLLAEPQCDLLGITTVQGNTYDRAKLASALVLQSGKSIPVFEGTREPILGNEMPFPGEPAQAKALERMKHLTEFRRDWLEFARQTIRSNPNEVTLLAIGPMTNVGLLFAYDPELAGLLKQLVLMCGAFYRKYQENKHAEWNAKGDPAATDIVYRAACGVHRSVGLDVTKKVTMSSEQVKERFQGELLSLVMMMAELWFDKRDIITFHDPLAAVSIFHPEVITYEKGTVSVDRTTPGSLGFTEFIPSDGGNTEVACGVDRDLFMKRFFGVFE